MKASSTQYLDLSRRATLTRLIRTGTHPIIVSMGIFAGNVKELDVVFPLIDKARALLGEKALEELLLPIEDSKSNKDDYSFDKGLGI